MTAPQQARAGAVEAVTLVLRQAAREHLGLEDGDYWPSGVAEAQAAALVRANLVTAPAAAEAVEGVRERLRRDDTGAVAEFHEDAVARPVRLTAAEREVLRPVLARYAQWESAHDGPVFEAVESIITARTAAAVPTAEQGARDRAAEVVPRVGDEFRGGRVRTVEMLFPKGHYRITIDTYIPTRAALAQPTEGGG